MKEKEAGRCILEKEAGKCILEKEAGTWIYEGERGRKECFEERGREELGSTLVGDRPSIELERSYSKEDDGIGNWYTPFYMRM